MSYTIVNLPYITQSADALKQEVDLKNIRLHEVEQQAAEISVPARDVTHVLTRQDETRALYRVEKMRHKNDPTREVYRYTLVEQRVAEYDFQQLQDFHFETPISEQRVLDSFKQWIEHPNQNELFSGNADQRIYQYMLKPKLFMHNLKHCEAGLFKNRSKTAHEQGALAEQDNAYPDNERGGVERQKYNFHSISIRYIESGQGEERVNFQVPTKPRQPITPDVESDKLFILMKSLFEKRPVWLRNSMIYTIKQHIEEKDFPQYKFRRYLSYLSYNFKNGPWKHCQVRFAYNPHLDRLAIRYQIFDVSVNERASMKEAKNFKHYQYKLYDPTYQDKPTNYRNLYQICDIVDDQIRRLFEQFSQSALKDDNRKCDNKSGWFLKAQYRRIHNLLKDKYKLTV